MNSKIVFGHPVEWSRNFGFSVSLEASKGFDLEAPSEFRRHELGFFEVREFLLELCVREFSEGFYFFLNIEFINFCEFCSRDFSFPS